MALLVPCHCPLSLFLAHVSTSDKEKYEKCNCVLLVGGQDTTKAISCWDHVHILILKV